MYSWLVPVAGCTRSYQHIVPILLWFVENFANLIFRLKKYCCKIIFAIHLQNWAEMEFAVVRLIFLVILIGSDVGVALYNRYNNIPENKVKIFSLNKS